MKGRRRLLFAGPARLFRRELSGEGIAVKTALVCLLIAVSYIFLFPLLRMLSMSLMSEADLIDPEVDWVPRELTFRSFRIAAGVLQLGRTGLNSFWFTFALASAQTAVSALTAFALARYRFAGHRFCFFMVLLSFVVPVPMVIIPRIMLFVSIQEFTGLKMIGTIWPQLAAAAGGQGVYSTILILIFYNFFRIIPAALEEAARIDGAGSLQVFYHIFLRLSLPTVFTVFLFSFLWNWNETYITTTFIRTSLRLIPLQLAVFDSAFARMAGSLPEFSDGARINEAYKMAATFISIAPLLILYGFVQRYFIQGIERTGITGE